MWQITDSEIRSFQATVLDHFSKNARTMPWREPEKNGLFDPYKILVSEVMLQQTQVNRVTPKYQEFIARFPTIQKLAASSLGEVLKVWSGLGYNRRAKYLWQTAQKVEQEFKGTIPDSVESLVTFPGIGKNTAAAVCAYAYNKPVIFIETNIRTVFIYHFFEDRHDVSDEEILSLVKNTLPNKDFRKWYWALMDYGTWLKTTKGNKSRQAKAYVKQSAFIGSRRQIRGMVLRALGAKSQDLEQLKRIIHDDRLESICEDLLNEGLIRKSKQQFSLE